MTADCPSDSPLTNYYEVKNDFWQPHTFVISLTLTQSVYASLDISVSVANLLSSPNKAHVQNGVSSSYMDAVFKLMAHQESEIWTSLPQFYQESLTTALRLAKFVLCNAGIIIHKNLEASKSPVA